MPRKPLSAAEHAEQVAAANHRDEIAIARFFRSILGDGAKPDCRWDRPSPKLGKPRGRKTK